MSATADSKPIAFCSKFRPTIWHRLGFGGRRPEYPEELDEAPEWAPGWFTIETRAKLDWKDRLRVLISGRIDVICRMKTDAPVERSIAFSSVAVMPPGEMK